MKYNPRVVIAFFEACGLPTPTLEYRFHPTRKWRFDFAWVTPKVTSPFPWPAQKVAQKIALEVQGGLFTGGRHTQGAALVAEHEKLNEAAALGWVIFFVQPQHLCTKATVDFLKRAMDIEV